MAINTANIHGMNLNGSDATPEQFGHLLRDAWTGAVSGLAVKQNTTPNMTVLVERGTALLTKNTFSSVVAEVKADTSVTISTANTSNPRIDAIVIYEDTSVTFTPYIVDGVGGRFKLAAVVGIPAASPAAPTDATINTEIGAGKPWTRLANVTVAANTTTIINSNVADQRTMLTPASLADGSVTPTKMSAAAFGQVQEASIGTELDYATGATVLTLSNYPFRANVPYLIMCASGMTQVNGGTAIWEVVLACSGTVDYARFQSLPSASQQSAIKLFGTRVFLTDTTASVTLTVNRATGDNTFRVGSPRITVIPLISTRAV